jgi:hypothetical protein
VPGASRFAGLLQRRLGYVLATVKAVERSFDGALPAWLMSITLEGGSTDNEAIGHGSTTEGSMCDRASRSIRACAERRAKDVAMIREGLSQQLVAWRIDARNTASILNAVDVDRFCIGHEADARLRSLESLGAASAISTAGWTPGVVARKVRSWRHAH